jgi:phenylacetate-coenzyme A ligase PaaK-like adenylate-forming protein
MITDLRNSIFEIKDRYSFERNALEIFKYQVENNPVYKDFTEQLHTDNENVRSLHKIPFLPIEFFKNHKIISGEKVPSLVFESSGTTGLTVSHHYIADKSLYIESFSKAFSFFYGDPADYFIAALLPSYIERKGSSLVYMMNNLIEKSRFPASGFYRENVRELIDNINLAKTENQKILLIGVTYALLELAESSSPDLSGIIVMETGGMKGRRKEVTREELHSKLRAAFNVKVIHSEYGMTELLSQAYSKGNGIFYTPPWMKILIRDPLDPQAIISEPGITGGINIIDLANIDSCSFIATADLGKLSGDGSFEVLGRFDTSDIRGCNLMIQ